MSLLVVHVEIFVHQGTLVLMGRVHVFQVRHPAMADALIQDWTLIIAASAGFHVLHLGDNSATMEHAFALRAIYSAMEHVLTLALMTITVVSAGTFVLADHSVP
jgi:hypothetical protein